MIDEISGDGGFAADKSTSPDFSVECTAFLHVVRAAAPFQGSWGLTSAGIERSPACP